MGNVVERDSRGRITPGSSLNPSGRPKGNPAVKELLKAHSVEAAEKLVGLLNCGNEKVELAAAQEILNRTEGKPLQTQDVQITSLPDVRTQIKEMLVERAND